MDEHVIEGLGKARVVVRDGRVDLVSLSRPFIREPFLVRKFRLGELARSACVSCNKCFNPRGISCGDLGIRERGGESGRKT